MTLSNFEQNLDQYEKGIIETLRNKYGMEDALDKFLEYHDVMKRLDRFESPEQKADILAKAIQKGIKPDDWLRHIEKMERARRDLYVKENPLLAQQEKEIRRLQGQVTRLRKKVQSRIPNNPKAGRVFGSKAEAIQFAREVATLTPPFKGVRNEVRGRGAFGSTSELQASLTVRGYADGVPRRVQEGKAPFQARVKTMHGDLIVTVGEDSQQKAIGKKGQG
ncbi:hypothetical protein [Brevibacillus formosus]|uniref:hypothetical protein n=1 Tax=Brevibacillus formosus TaxID=54913 RepID=UPI003F196FAA